MKKLKKRPFLYQVVILLFLLFAAVDTFAADDEMARLSGILLKNVTRDDYRIINSLQDQWLAKNPVQPFSKKYQYQKGRDLTVSKSLETTVNLAAPVYIRILVLANSALYADATAKAKIDRYINDIQNAFGCTVVLETVSGGTPADIKNILQSYYSSGLNGAVFIGRITPAMYEVPNDHYWWDGGYGYAKWPCDLYYMDLDGGWFDNDNNGIFDNHTDGSGDKSPEIFVGRIDTRTMGYFGTEVSLFAKYMDKNHNYWAGNVPLLQKGLIYTERDWVGSASDLPLVHGSANVTKVEYPNTSKTDWLNNRCQTEWGLVQCWTHGSWDSHSLTGGSVTTIEAVNARPKWLGFNFISCSVANWVAGGDRRFLCGGYVYNDSPRALVAVASSKTGGMLYNNAFYSSLSQNNCMGQALADWFKQVIDNYRRYNSDYGYILGWFYGMQVVGDPLIVFKQLSTPQTPPPTPTITPVTPTPTPTTTPTIATLTPTSTPTPTMVTPTSTPTPTQGTVQPIILDSENAEGISFVGTWNTGTYWPDRYGANYKYDSPNYKGSMSCTYTPNIPLAGNYNVYMWWTQGDGTNRATNVPLEIRYNGGTDTSKIINQCVNGGRWNLIGTYNFAAGTSGYVRIKNNGTNNNVIADAVRFEYAGTASTPTPTPSNATPTITASISPTPTSSIYTPTPTPTPSTNWVVRPFGLNQVTLQTSLFAANRDRTYSYLLYLNNDRMLYNFKVTAGLSTNGASPPGGWEAPDCKLRGHGTGHYLSALAQAYASSGNSQFKTKIDYMVAELKKCQDALPSRGYSPGFLAAYPETQFIQLESLTTYPTIWAPYYTCHKIMAGLIDCYKLAGNTTALDIVCKMGDWVYGRLSKLTRARLQQMWGLYIAGEYGGMNEVMAELYTITGKATYLTAATYFDNDKLFTPCSNNQDRLSGLHANQHIPQITGALRIYDQNNNNYYYNIAENFWNMVTGSHMYIIGGTGEGEMFRGINQIASYITANTCETCATYNMLKLTRNLFFHNPAAKYMDYYERALYNHILASQDQASSHGFTTYFVPLNPGARKTYSNDYNSFTCCHGTGMENHTKYQESIYFYSSDMTTLYVNLYIPSTLNWQAKGFIITQTTDYPSQQGTSITINGNGQLAIKLRVPFWAQNGFTVRVNGVVQSITANPGTYITLSRVWASGDRIEVSMPFSLRLERTPDNSSIGGYMYGPILLVGRSSSTSYITMPSDLSRIVPAGAPLNYTANGISLVPMFSAYNFNYHAYFRIE